MCQRLDCMKHLWTQKDASGAGTQSNDNFWTKDVQDLWDELAGAMITNGGTGETACNKVGINGTPASPSEKAACKFLHAGLQKLYGPAPPATPPAAPSVLDNPSFRQTMGCFLLHAYAKHMKEKATCLIDEGIQKAFETVGNKGVVPCQWQGMDDSKWENCLDSITINGGAAVSGETAKTKVDNILKGDSKIEDMAKEVNNVTQLCDQVKCVTNRWMSQNKAGGTGTRTWKNVWEEVQKELTKLAGGTTKKKREDSALTPYCNDIPKVNGKAVDKEACLLIAAGLKNLYDIKEDKNHDVDAVTASFLRTMQCVLLNAIADKLQDEKFPCKDEKNVQKGINHAFEKSNSAIKGKSACSSNDKCFECKRVPLTELATCEIGEKDGKKLKEKIEEDLLKEDENTEMKKIKDQAIKDIC
ncbi:SICAvar, type I (fragment), partial [Plasmodium knowlesi strain H]